MKVSGDAIARAKAASKATRRKAVPFILQYSRSDLSVDVEVEGKTVGDVAGALKRVRDRKTICY